MQKHRISTNIGKDQRVTVEIKQDYDLLEILSLKFSQQDVYTSLCADYGVVCGRVTANDGFGIPNAKVSIFVPQLTKDSDDPVISALYPYTSISEKDENNYRYNLLPSRKQHGGHVPTGTFPDQTDILTREEYLEVYESYYTYTVKTNESGDFMIWGVPLGQQTINVDIDLSDIGCFSLRPYDFIKKGVGIDQFDRYYNFKSGSDIDGLPQIINFQKTVEVYPFWGNIDLCQIGITRTDFDLLDKGIKIEPISLILMSTITDDNGDAIKRSGVIRRKSGYKCNLQTTEGRIEAVRYTGKKVIGSDKVTLYPELEYFNPSESIDTDGTAMVVIPMNMEYVYTNEFGEQEITNDINKGIPTTTVARFRFTLDGNNDKTGTAKYLVPQIREYNKNANGSNNLGEYDEELLTTYQFSNVFEDYLNIVPPEGVTTSSMSTAFSNDKKSLMLGTNNGGVPEDVFYKFIFGKIYTVSSFQGSHYETSSFENLLGISRKDAFLGIKEIRPNVEDDCASKANYFPTNFGFKNRIKFGLIISEILLFLQYIFTIAYVFIIETLAGALFTIGRFFGPFSPGFGTRPFFDIAVRFIKLAFDLQESGQIVLPLTTYPTCEECTSDVDTVDPSNNTTFIIEEGCKKYDKFYNENLVYAYIWSFNNSYGLNTVPSNAGNINGPNTQDNASNRMSFNHLATNNPWHLLGKPYYASTPNLKEQLVSPGDGWTIMAAVAGATGTNINIDVSGTQYDVLNVFNTTTRRLPNIVETEGGLFSYNKKTKSGLTEIRDGVITVVPVIDGPSKNIDVIKEWYKRKRVGVFFCGGVVNYSFIDNWLNGILYFFKFDKRIRWDDEAALDLNQRGTSYPRELVFYNVLDKEFYYRATPYNNITGLTQNATGTTFNFVGQQYSGYKEILHPTTFYDVGVRDEFLYEICQDPRVDPTCSVVRDINATSYQDPSNIVEYAINYRLDTNNGNFDVGDFFTGVGLGSNVNVLDGDITQLMSINCEAGIEAFDLDSPHYFFYNGEIMDPEDITLSDFFTDDFGNYGPTPIDLKFDNNGAFIRQCLNFRLGDYTQKVPFYLWDKKGTGFGGYTNGVEDDQSWDKTSIASMKLQRLFSISGTTMPTTGYTTNYVMADGEEEYLLRPITKTHNGHSFDGDYADMLERFENISLFAPPTGATLAVNYVEGDIWLHVTSGTTKNPLKGDIYVVVEKTWTKEINRYVSNSKETFLFQTRNNYTGNKQVLSTPFLFYFGLRPDKTSLDTLIKYYGPKGAFPSTDFCLDVITPVPTPTITPTPTTTLTPTPTPTPTKTINTDVDPNYFYYMLGDCNNMRYSYTGSTITGFSPPIQIPGCGTLSEIGVLSLNDPATTSIILSNPLKACGFGDGYVSTIIGRSTTGVTEQSVYNIDGKCLSAIAVETDYVTGWTVNLDSKTPVGIGYDACNSSGCNPPFTGFTATGYSGITCDTGENVVVYSILGALTIDRVYGIQLYSGGTVIENAKCMTLKSNLGPQYTFTDPTADGITGYGISDSGPFILGEPMFQGYADCANCNLTERKYMITGDRCDITGSVTIWSATVPTVVSGDTMTVSVGETLVCFLVTQADQFTSVVYNDVGFTIVDTGCDCNGNDGGSNVNVTNVNTSSESYSLTSECQSPQNEYYVETIIDEIEITFRGVNNTLVVPNEAVQYRINGGTWVPLIVTTSTITLSVTLTYGDRTVCDGGGTFADTLDIKVGTITVLNYVAGQ